MSDKRSYYVIDIETGSVDNWKDYIEPFDPEKHVKWGNLKDVDKKATRIPQEKAIYWQRAESRAALSPVTGKILMVGIYNSKTDDAYTIEGREEDILKGIWDVIREADGSDLIDIVGHNIEKFDMPFITKRSWFKKVTPIRTRRGRYLNHYFKDTMMMYQDYSMFDSSGNKVYTSLDTLGKLLGVGGKNPEDSKNFAQLYYSNPAKAKAHCVNDIMLTSEIFQILNNCEDSLKEITPNNLFNLPPEEELIGETDSSNE